MSEGPVETTSRRSRGGGRTARRELRTTSSLRQLPPLERNLPLWQAFTEEHLERIHEASLTLLEEIGCEFRDADALEVWRHAGADIDGERVRIPRELVMALMASAPSSFTLQARNPDRSTPIGGNHTVFAPTYGSPFVLDLNNERRYGTLADLHQFHQLAYLSPVMHNTGAVVCEPVDIPVPVRHLHITHSALYHSDKPFMGPVTAPERAADAVRMAELVFGEAAVAAGPVMISLCNCNSPLVWDDTMLGALKTYARANQAVIVAPFVLAGANTPASTMAALAQLNAEALAGMAFVQAVRPGAPMVYGHFLATVSMRTGAPMAGTPEIALLNLAVPQLARKYGVPSRSSGMTTGSKIVDAQAAYEASQTLWPIMLAGTNYLLHAAGWLEAGLSASFAKFMLDCEQLEGLYRLWQGPQFNDFDEALDAVREVGPGGHYLGSSHTQKYFESAFFLPKLADNNSFEQWTLDGRQDANTRALEAARRALASYQPPPLDPSVADALQAYIAKREEEIPRHGYE